jgi:hypothetical protein
VNQPNERYLSSNSSENNHTNDSALHHRRRAEQIMLLEAAPVVAVHRLMTSLRESHIDNPASGCPACSNAGALCVRVISERPQGRALAGEITERGLVNLLESARELASTQKYCELAKKHSFDLDGLFPDELAKSKLEKVARIAQFRLSGSILYPGPDSNTGKVVEATSGTKEGPSSQPEVTGKLFPNWSLDDFTPGSATPEKDREFEL